MNRSLVANGAGLAAALLAAAVASWSPGGGGAGAPKIAGTTRVMGQAPALATQGAVTGVEDASGQLVPIRPYRRIVSTSLMTDRLLVELCEADRILAFSTAGVRRSPWSHQYAGKPAVDGFGPVEGLIALQPDLVIMNSFGGLGRVAQLRGAGIQVFELGELRGVATLTATARSLAALLGHPGRGERFAAGFERRMRNVAARLGSRRRLRAVYIATFGPQLFGGAQGTSYHDVIEAAGLVDAAAGRFRDWPQYSAEQVVQLAPDVVVTKRGMGAAVCAHPGLDGLPACQRQGGIIELPSELLDEPGPSMLDAAELLHDLAYP